MGPPKNQGSTSKSWLLHSQAGGAARWLKRTQLVSINKLENKTTKGEQQSSFTLQLSSTSSSTLPVLGIYTALCPGNRHLTERNHSIRRLRGICSLGKILPGCRGVSMEGKVCQGKQGKPALQGVFMARHKNSTTSTTRELPKPTMQRRRLPLDGRSPQARPEVSCSKHGVVLLWNSLPKLRSPRDRRTTAHNVLEPPPAFPLRVCTTAGACPERRTRAGHMHIRGVWNHWLQNRSK